MFGAVPRRFLGDRDNLKMIPMSATASAEAVVCSDVLLIDTNNRSCVDKIDNILVSSTISSTIM